MDKKKNGSKFDSLNMKSPQGSMESNGRVHGVGGINGIKSIHTRVAKGPTSFGKRDVFNEYDQGPDKRGSIDSGGYSHQDVSALGVSAEQQLLPGRNGSKHQAAGVQDRRRLGEEGLQVGGSPPQKYGMNGTNSYKTSFKSRNDGPEGLQNGRTPGLNTTTGKNRLIFDNPNMSGYQATGYNRYQSKSRPGALVSNQIVYRQVHQQELPETALDAMDYTKRLRFEELKKTTLDATCDWKKKDVRGIKKNAYIKEIQKKNNKILTKQPKDALEQLEVDTDRFPLLQCRKAIRRVLILLQMVCRTIISTKAFETFTICVIVANSAVMVVDDPAAEEPEPIFVVAEHIFNLLYFLEMVLKIVGLGFILGEDAYLRDTWNILDFAIVMSALPQYVQYLESSGSTAVVRPEVGPKQEQSSGSGISGLRAFRVLRPLRTITSIQGLKVLITALFAAMPLLRDTLLILMFFFVVFSIACLQLLAGSLKQRCVSIQTGAVHPDDLLCGSGVTECPGGYFCGKQNANPNYGVTNFDSIQYSLLNVFQCITLEGWSDIQAMMQRTFASVVVILFIVMILSGAFFLLNLLLAVINSKFTEAHNEHQQQEEAARAQKRTPLDDDEMDNALNNKDEWTISQAITARIYAKKMKAFLYRRKAQRAAEARRREALKKQRQASQQARRNIPGQVNHLSNGNGNGNGKTPPHVGGVIMEDDGEHQEEQLNDEEKHLQQVQDLLQSSKIGMQREGKIVNDLKMRKTLKQEGAGRLKEQTQMSNPVIKSGAPTLMGNIGPTKNKYLNPVAQRDLDHAQKKLFSKMAEEFDIDNVIPKAQQKKETTKDAVAEHSINSFDLSIDYDAESRRASSRGNLAHSTMDGNGFKLAVGHNNLADDASGGLISSDSDFEAAAAKAGHKNQLLGQQALGKRNSEDLKKDVSKTFKRMLTQNNRRTNPSAQPRGALDETGNGNDSTKYEGSKYDQDPEVQTQISEIESKFAKKKKNFKHLLKNKMYKEDYVDGEDPVDGDDGPIDQGQDQDFNLKQLEEFISTKRPKDPFLELKPLTEKVVINPSAQYQGSSQQEIFQQRLIQQAIRDRIEGNKFLKLPQGLQESVDPDFADTGRVRNCWLPYQQKVQYNAVADSSEVGDESDRSPNEDDLCAEEQPYETPTSIAYQPWLKQIPIVELARRSDIVITSTLSQNLIAKDKRLINEKCFALMKRSELREYIDELNAFRAMAKEIQYRAAKVRDKDKDYRDNYMKSFIHRSKFRSKTLAKFKKSVMVLNSNKKQVQKKDKQQREQEKMKHEQNKRAAEKRGLPTFTRQDAQKLLAGKYHDDDDEEEDVPPAKVEEAPLAQERSQQPAHQLEQFENEIHRILEPDDAAKKAKIDEIPPELRKEFQFPVESNLLEVDFKEIRKHDATKKRARPIWSGQDVLPDKLDSEKSQAVIAAINRHRVWPVGAIGLWKRVRFVLRLHVKSDFFDSLMTFAVVLNTVTLSLDQHNQPKELEEQIEEYNTVFTYLFIYEMGTKILALGVQKYLADKMNWLDGGVVLLSIFEIIYQKMQEGQGVSLSAFKTMRLFRTFRVFRIARLLRALESMQMILRVIAASYTSYVYITALLFLFIFIFLLLGMQMFGGQMNYRSGLPRGNFDSAEIALLTVFQVLTMENWQTLLFDLMRGEIPKLLAACYLILWIFVGNFILLNLFLAILLDSFIEEDQQEEDQDEKAERTRLKQQRAKERAKRKDRKKVYMQARGRKGADAAPSKRQAAEEEEEDLEDLDEEQIEKIYQSQGILKKTKKEIEEETTLFDGIGCATSVYLFSKENRLRIGCYKLWKHKLWEQVVMALILLSSAKLATDTFNERIESLVVLDLLRGVDAFFNYAFMAELTVKVIAMGLVMDEGSYLLDSWNQLDFFIVASSIADMLLHGFELPFIRILRMLRVLRPLRFISRNVGLKTMVVALLDSVGHIVNVSIVVAMVWLVFAILGVNFLMGHSFYCSIDPYVLHTEQECLIAGGSWERYDHNFDDVAQAYVSLFVVSSLEGWPDICIQALDGSEADRGPEFLAFPNMMIYFIAYILIGSFFLLNFFIGVLFLKFNQAQKEEQKGLSPRDLGWMDVQKLILQAEPEYSSTNVPENPIRKYFHDLVSSDRFDLVIMSCIILNMVQMACFSEGMSDGMIWFLAFTNTIFTIVFIAEAVLKLIAYGKSYFANAWNRFDFFVVCSSIIDFILAAMDSDALDGAKVLPQLARVMRVLRITRLLKFADGLQAIIQTIMFSIPSLANVFGLLMLIFFMFAVCGNSLFAEVRRGDVIDDLKNFGDFLSAFILLFAVSTGEDWNKIMFDCSRTEADGCVAGETCGSSAAIPYFFLMVLMCTHVMLNLFILVIIRQFEQYYLPADNMIEVFKRDLSAFMLVWKQETQARYRCLKIKEKQLPRFFRVLGDHGGSAASLGFGTDQYDAPELKKQMLKMAIRPDNGYVYFNELLYRCMRRKHGNMKSNKKMQECELATQHRIFQLTQQVQGKGHLHVSNDDIKHALVKKENGVNPFLTVMNFTITFRAWSRAARRRLDEASGPNDAHEAQVKVIAVDIDVENIYSATSDEDEAAEYGDGRMGMSRSRSGAALAVSMSGGSVHGSNSDKASSRKQRVRDHLELFQRKMTAKLQESLVESRILSSSKKGIPDSKEGRNKMLRSITKRQQALNDLSASARFKKR